MGKSELRNQVEKIISPKFFVILDYIEENLSLYRTNHIYRVVLFSHELAKRFFPQNELLLEKAKLAALLHDITKEEKKEFHVELFRKYQMPNHYWDVPFPVMHGKSAPLFAKEKFGIDDAEISEACAFHTTGKAGMGPVAQIVFAADMLGSMSDEEVKSLEGANLNRLCLEKVKYSLKSVLDKEGQIHPDSWLFYDSLIKP